MLPRNAISSPAYPAPFLSPDTHDSGRRVSLERGGIALNDPSRGRDFQDWRAWIEDDTVIKVAPLSGTPETILVTGVDITRVSLAFDSNMQPTVTYTEGGVVKLRWFDTTIAAYRTDAYPSATSSKVATDDKRSGQEGPSDVIFAYTRDGGLYWRQQRDRYSIERYVGPAVGFRLSTIGMNELNRFQFRLVSL